MTWPSHWDSTQLGNEELFSTENGIWQGKRLPLVACKVLRNTNFADDGTLDFTNVARIEIEKRLLDKKRLIRGDIIIERSGGGPQQPVGRVAYFDQNDGEFCFSNFTTRLRVVSGHRADSRFIHKFLLYLHMSGQTEPLQRRTTGIRNLAFGDYLKLTIPLPPVVEQRSIVRVLDAVHRAKHARQRELVLEGERKAALMEFLFTQGTCGDPTKQTEIGEIPQSWRVVPLDEIAELVSGGTPSRQSVDWWKGRIPWASPKDMKKLRLWDTEEHVSNAGLEAGSRLVPAQTIFIVIRGMVLAKDVPIAITEVPMAFNQDMKAVLPGEEVMPEFLLYALIWRKDGLTKYIGTSAHGTRRISTEAVGSLALPIPPLSEQAKIAELLRACDNRIDAIEREIPLHQELFQTMLEEMMTGRLSAVPLIEEHQAQ